MIKFGIAHPYLFSAIATFLFNNVISAMVSNLPAPTKDASVKYVYWFKVANTVIGNLQRAKSTSIEQSPNFQAAVDARIEQLIADHERIKAIVVAKPADPPQAT